MRDTVPPGLFDRALRRLTAAWRDMAAGVAPAADESVAAQMRACLLGRGGEVSARNRAAKLAHTYLAADAAGRRDFLRALAGFDSDPASIEAAYARLRDTQDPAERAAAQAELRGALEPPRLKLLTQFTTIPDGGAFLVDLRAFLLEQRETDPLLAALETDLRGLLAAWFDPGFLELRRIDWSSPAMLLEKLVGYEAVHAIRSWRDLKNRLESDRRCYAFFHPRMPTEPLIFVEVALVDGLAASVQRLLDPTAPPLDPSAADTALFYSISNCQRGLAGISFGIFLIRRVIVELAAEFPTLRDFATLSPVPGFRRWLDPLLDAGDVIFTEDEAADLRAAVPGEEPHAALTALLARPFWPRDPILARAAEPALLRLCARYLLEESHGTRARDPVAHFHLSNGARIERINMLGDVSEKGMRQSATLMVNYVYDLATIEQSHESYAGDGRREASTNVRRLGQSSVINSQRIGQRRRP